jgi:hypothetical protein
VPTIVTWSPALATPPPSAAVELLLTGGWVLVSAELGAVSEAVVPDGLLAPAVVADDADDAGAWTVEVTVTGAVAAFELLPPHAARLPATAAATTISAKRTRAMTFPTLWILLTPT